MDAIKSVPAVQVVRVRFEKLKKKRGKHNYHRKALEKSYSIHEFAKFKNYTYNPDNPYTCLKRIRKGTVRWGLEAEKDSQSSTLSVRDVRVVQVELFQLSISHLLQVVSVEQHVGR